MKIFILCFFLVQGTVSHAINNELADIRLLFHKAESSEKVCIELIERLQPYNETNNVLFLGYRACATMLMAKHVFNPFSKLSYFKRGKEMLEKAIQVDHNNIELRFLRYTIQTNVPLFLNYYQAKDSDRLFLVNSVSNLNDRKLKNLIRDYLKITETV